MEKTLDAFNRLIKIDKDAKVEPMKFAGFIEEGSPRHEAPDLRTLVKSMLPKPKP